MNTVLYRALVVNEWRLRSRRVSSLVVLLAVVALSWLMVLDPRSGLAMMVVHKQRMAYESATLAFGTTLMASLLFGLAGFYLARGRVQEDLRCGVAGVLAATPVGNAQLLGARWLGAFGFLLSLGGAVMLTVWVLQLVRGEGPLQPLPYLQMLALGLAPGLMWCASVAVLADAWAPLMGRRGDVLYWVLWVLQSAFLPATLGQGSVRLTGWQVFDVQGLSPLLVALSRLLDVQQVSVGGGRFDTALPVLHMPDGLWTPELVALRIGAMVVAVLPLAAAAGLFHRYAPDRVRPVTPAGRRRLAGMLHRLLGPLVWLWRAGVGQLLRAAARVPGVAGRLLADLGLVLLGQPVLGYALVAGMVAATWVPPAALPGVLAATLAAWGLAVADISAVEWQGGTAALTAALPGGARERRWRRAWVAVGLGWGVALPTLLRWAPAQPGAVVACLGGVAFLSVAGVVLGELTRGSRTFLALFLFALYLNLQRTGLPGLDLLGLAGDATAASSACYAALAGAGLLALMAGGRPWGRR